MWDSLAELPWQQAVSRRGTKRKRLTDRDLQPDAACASCHATRSALCARPAQLSVFPARVLLATHAASNATAHAGRLRVHALSQGRLPPKRTCNACLRHRGRPTQARQTDAAASTHSAHPPACAWASVALVFGSLPPNQNLLLHKLPLRRTLPWQLFRLYLVPPCACDVHAACAHVVGTSPTPQSSPTYIYSTFPSPFVSITFLYIWSIVVWADPIDPRSTASSRRTLPCTSSRRLLA